MKIGSILIPFQKALELDEDKFLKINERVFEKIK